MNSEWKFNHVLLMRERVLKRDPLGKCETYWKLEFLISWSGPAASCKIYNRPKEEILPPSIGRQVDRTTWASLSCHTVPVFSLSTSVRSVTSVKEITTDQFYSSLPQKHTQPCLIHKFSFHSLNFQKWPLNGSSSKSPVWGRPFLIAAHDRVFKKGRLCVVD